MDFTEIRRRVIVAMFSDDLLLDRLVLKGGNALELVHQVLTRGSVDVDLSVDGEFVDLADFRERIFQALRRGFESAGTHRRSIPSTVESSESSSISTNTAKGRYRRSSTDERSTSTQRKCASSKI